MFVARLAGNRRDLSSQMGFTVFMNIAGAIFAITAIVLYVLDLENSSVVSLCDRSRSRADRYGDNCRNVALYGQVSRVQMKLETTRVKTLCFNVFMQYVSVISKL